MAKQIGIYNAYMPSHNDKCETGRCHISLVFNVFSTYQWFDDTVGFIKHCSLHIQAIQKLC